MLSKNVGEMSSHDIPEWKQTIVRCARIISAINLRARKELKVNFFGCTFGTYNE